MTFAFLAQILLFQNCTDTFNTKAALSTGNGGSYGGKPYINISPSVCADGTSVNAKIEVGQDLVGNTTALLTRENCQDIAPRSLNVADLKLLAHNTENLIRDGKVFDLTETSSPTPTSSLLCRWTLPSDSGGFFPGMAEPPAGGFYVEDSVIHSVLSADGSYAYSGSLRLGSYKSDGSLIQAYSGDFPLLNAIKRVSGQITTMNQLSYDLGDSITWGQISIHNSTYDSQPYQMTLYTQLIDGVLKGSLAASFLGQAPQSIDPPPMDTPNFSVVDMGMMGFPMDCYTQLN